jgi:hypothetical protein
VHRQVEVRFAAVTMMVVCWCGVAFADGDVAPTHPDAPQVILLDPTVPQSTDAAGYRGREPGSSAGNDALWVPRIVLSPYYVITQYGIREPTYALVTWMERKHITTWISKVFQPTPNIEWSPTATIDLGVFAAVGLHGRFKNVLVKGHEVDLSVAVGGPDAWFLSGKDTWAAGPAHMGIKGNAFSRSDRSFYGFGPYSTGPRTYFNQTRIEGFGFASVEAKNHFKLEVLEGFRSDDTGPGVSPIIESRWATGSSRGSARPTSP